MPYRPGEDRLGTESTLHFPYPPEKCVLKPELCKLSLVQFPLSLGFSSEHLAGQRGVPALSL